MTNNTYHNQTASATAHIKTECPDCYEKRSKSVCKSCGGNGIARFYYNAIKSADNLVTKEKRRRHLKEFANYLGLNYLQELATFFRIKGTDEDFVYLEERIIDFVVKELREKRRSANKTQAGYLSNLQRSYELNRDTARRIPWDIIRTEHLRHPVGLKSCEYNPYEHSKLKILYDNSNLQYKAILAVLVSGMRIGGLYENITFENRRKYPDRLHFLKIKDLKLSTAGFTSDDMRDFGLALPGYTDVYRMIIYADQVNAKTGRSEQYPCYCTPEAFSLINQMLAKRQREGELDAIDKKYRDLECWGYA
ncbi:MAG: hypothetical protein DLM72_19070 [Candidatus Nitrosopolaris wilkensis]|nr:MAG: hypothetical protein DLM72_19070 [Candidatus Nitrosopolaris wilkensis]